MNLQKLYNLSIMSYGEGTRRLLGSWSLAPLNVLMEITYACNLTCDFCQFRKGAGLKKELPSSFFRDLSLSFPPFTLLSFTGGEPFVKPGFMDMLAEVSAKRRVHIFTNGTLVDGARAQSLVSWAPRRLMGQGVLLIGFSVEGIGEIHDRVVGKRGSFQRVEEAVMLIREERLRQRKDFPKMELKVVLTPRTLENIIPLYFKAHEWGMDMFDLMAINSIPHESRIDDGEGIPRDTPPPPIPPKEIEKILRTLSHLEEELRVPIRFTPQGGGKRYFLDHYRNRVLLEGYTCYAPWTTLGVNPRGIAYICPYRKVGDLKEEEWREVFNGPRARDFRKRVMRGLFPGCQGCCFLVKKPQKVVRAKEKERWKR